jgi:hypothetical protein
MRFNYYLCGLALLLVVGGCATTEDRDKKKEASTLRLHLEADPDDGKNTSMVPIYRNTPVAVSIQKAPFLDEGNLINAAVVDVIGGFAIQVQYDFRGKLALESTTAANRGRKVAVFSQFTEGRWLAAPMINKRIDDGVFTFTPDATREEAERIVNGLNNIAVTLGNRQKDPKKKK